MSPSLGIMYSIYRRKPDNSGAGGSSQSAATKKGAMTNISGKCRAKSQLPPAAHTGRQRRPSCSQFPPAKKDATKSRHLQGPPQIICAVPVPEPQAVFVSIPIFTQPTAKPSILPTKEHPILAAIGSPHWAAAPPILLPISTSEKKMWPCCITSMVRLKFPARHRCPNRRSYLFQFQPTPSLRQSRPSFLQRSTQS